MAITTRKPLRKGSTVRRGVQDVREDSDRLVFFAKGLDNNIQALVTAGEQVVSELGGNSHTSPATATGASIAGPPIHSWTGRYLGKGRMIGELVYAHGNLSCIGDRIRSSIGFVEARGAQAGAVESLSSGGPCDVSGISLPNLQRRRVSVEHISVRCIAHGTRPEPNEAMLGTINDAPYTILGLQYAAYTLRFDGISVSHQKARAGERYPFWLQFTYMAGGWISHELVCVRYEAIDTGGTLPTYVFQTESQQRYIYGDSTFDTLATLCPICDG